MTHEKQMADWGKKLKIEVTSFKDDPIKMESLMDDPYILLMTFYICSQDFLWVVC